MIDQLQHTAILIFLVGFLSVYIKPSESPDWVSFIIGMSIIFGITVGFITTLIRIWS